MTVIFLILGGFVVLFVALSAILSRDEGPHGFIIRVLEVGVPLCAAAVLGVLSIRLKDKHAGEYLFAAGAFGLAAWNALLRKILPDVPFLAGGQDEASTVIVYCFLLAVGCLFVASAVFDFLPS